MIHIKKLLLFDFKLFMSNIEKNDESAKVTFFGDVFDKFQPCLCFKQMPVYFSKQICLFCLF